MCLGFNSLEKCLSYVEDEIYGVDLVFQHTDQFGLYVNYLAYRNGEVVADFGWNFMTGKVDGDFLPLPSANKKPCPKEISLLF